MLQLVDCQGRPHYGEGDTGQTLFRNVDRPPSKKEMLSLGIRLLALHSVKNHAQLDVVVARRASGREWPLTWRLGGQGV